MKRDSNRAPSPVFSTVIGEKNICLSVIILMMFMFLCTSQSWAESVLEADAANFVEKTIVPFLEREKICSSLQDCTERHYLSCTSLNGLACELYGITNESGMKAVFLSMIRSNLKVSSFIVWRSREKDRSFLKRYILKEEFMLRYVQDHGGK